MTDIEGKMMASADALAGWRKAVARRGGSVAIVAGAFHILQPANLRALACAARCARHVCVLLEDDEELKRRLPGRPGSALGNRAEAVAFLKGISAVHTCRREEAAQALSALQPFTLVHCPVRDGDDELSVAARESAAARVELPLMPGCSTADVLSAIGEGRTPVGAAGSGVAAMRRNAPAQASGATVTVNGCFDVLHIGHLRFLRKAAGLGDRLVVLVNSDASVRRYKGADRPIFPLRFRRQALLAVEGVSAVMSFPDDNPLRLLERIRPSVHAKGGSYEPERVKAEAELLEQWGGRVEICSMVNGYSTSEFVKKVRDR